MYRNVRGIATLIATWSLVMGMFVGSMALPTTTATAASPPSIKLIPSEHFGNRVIVAALKERIDLVAVATGVPRGDSVIIVDSIHGIPVVHCLSNGPCPAVVSQSAPKRMAYRAAIVNEQGTVVKQSNLVHVAYKALTLQVSPEVDYSSEFDGRSAVSGQRVTLKVRAPHGAASSWASVFILQTPDKLPDQKRLIGTCSLDEVVHGLCMPTASNTVLTAPLDFTFRAVAMSSSGTVQLKSPLLTLTWRPVP